jgi:peptidoglycan/LPS O-acetylase OafA/YrhL
MRIRHLDGLRAVSVLLVFAFHAEVLGLTGGFLGVSVFFTLSGYLLTYRLLDVEPTWASARSYWAARWRRIMPASVAVLVAVVAMASIAELATGGPRSVWATLFGLKNWVQIADGSSYADLFANPDPLVHYWSLAIEEQVYLLLPLLLFALLRRSRRAAAIGLGVVATTSFLLPVLLGFSLTRTYYGTDTRAGEILVGSLLALLHARTASHDVQGRRRTIAHVAGLAGLAGVIGLSLAAVPTSPSIRTGLLPLTAACSIAIIHGARRTDRFAAGLLETAPLRWLGRLSYPIYLVHWPVLVLLGTWELSVVWRAVLAAAITLAVAWPLDRCIERPLRRSNAAMARRAALGAAVACLAALSIVAPTNASASLLDDLEREGADLQRSLAAATTTTLAVSTTSTTPTTPSARPPTSTIGSGGTPTTTTSTVPPSPRSVGVFGDSLALSVSLVLARQVSRDVVPLDAVSTKLGCGLVNTITVDRCSDVFTEWTDELRDHPVDVAVVVSCQWELLDRSIPGVGRRHVGEPEMDERIVGEYRIATQVLLDHGVDTVAWATCPYMSPTVGVPSDAATRRSREPARTDALNAIIRQLPDLTDGAVTLLDLAAWVDPRRDDAALRPDGAHFEWEQPTGLSEHLVELLSPLVRPDSGPDGE